MAAVVWLLVKEKKIRICITRLGWSCSGTHTVRQSFRGHTAPSAMVFHRTDQVFACLLVAMMAGAEVQDEFSPECKQFLYLGTKPRGLEDQPFKKICQFYDGKPRFVTLYDAFNHVPVYSAYTFKRSDGSKKVDVPWMYEPQVGCCVLGGNCIYCIIFVFINGSVYTNSCPQCLAPERCNSFQQKMCTRVLKTLRLFWMTTRTV